MRHDAAGCAKAQMIAVHVSGSSHDHDKRRCGAWRESGHLDSGVAGFLTIPRTMNRSPSRSCSSESNSSGARVVWRASAVPYGAARRTPVLVMTNDVPAASVNTMSAPAVIMLIGDTWG